MAKCGNCRFYIGLGDWSLCCSKDDGLHYGDSDVCDEYECGDEKSGYCPICDKTITAITGAGSCYCGSCGHHVVLHRMEVADGKV